MTSASTRRIALDEHARDSWGTDTAETLMDLLPADPDQFATKTDLAVLRAELREELAGLRVDLTEKMSEQTRMLMVTQLTTTVAIVLSIIGALAFT